MNYQELLRKVIYMLLPIVIIIISFLQMIQSHPELLTMQKSLSAKTILIQNNPNLKSEIRSYFLQTYSVYQKLFELLKTDEAYYLRSEPLRHPLIFYYGHTAALYANKFIDHGIIKERINPKLQKTFAVGVDEMDWDDLNSSHYDWPSLAQAREFRAKVKEMVLSTIDRSSTRKIENWLSDMWLVLMGIQHQRIHLETSAVIMRRVPINLINPLQSFVECQSQIKQLEKIPINKMVEVSQWRSSWQRKKDQAQTYGWDNQFGVKQFDVKGFKASQMLVSNGQYLQFVLQGGYQRSQLWTDEGKRWLASIHPNLPLFWRKNGQKYQLRTLFREIDMPWDWPAEVNNLQARAFCKWRTQKTGKYTRLPTEDEYYAIRDILKKDQTNWEYKSVGNINMQFWMSPNPVNMFKTGDFYDVVGNVWQHTITPIYPFQKFEIHPVYQDFTTPTFDQRHDMIKGGSFISTGNQALYHSRYAFRRHFYQFAGFRYIETEIQMQVDTHSTEVISDKNVEMNLKHHYLNDKSYVMQVVQKIKQKVGSKLKDKKVLTVGCSVGRIPIELGKIFGESIGIDYTTRYFQMSTRLQETGFLKFKDIDIDLKKLDIHNQNISLLQMNPSNPDQKKINNFDWIIIDGFSIRRDSLSEVLTKIMKLASRNANVVVVNVEGVNYVGSRQAAKLLNKTCNGEVQVGEQLRMQSSDLDQSYLPDWQRQLEFSINFYRVIEP